MEHWIGAWRFRQFRRYRSDGDPQPFRLTDGTRELVGLERSGSKRLKFPFGPIRPKRSRTICVRDEQLQRVLVVEYDARPNADYSVADRVALEMNWPWRESEDAA